VSYLLAGFGSLLDDQGVEHALTAGSVFQFSQGASSASVR